MVDVIMWLKSITLGLIGLIVAGAAASAEEITSVRFGEHSEYTRIVVETAAPVTFRAYTLAEPAARLVISFDRAEWGIAALSNGAGRGAGAVGDFSFDPAAGSPRLVFNLTEPSMVRQSMSLDPAGGGYRTVVDIEPVSPAAFERVSGFPGETMTLTQLLAERTDVTAAPPSCDVIRVVVDPGHGGSDPGAPGRFGGQSEAQVNLAAGLVLRDLLHATGRYQVIMTRDRDVHVSLEDRVRIARDARADLFISLHADAAPNSASARGATVYSMNHRAESRARSGAIQRGEWVDTNRPEEVSRILVEMSLTNKRSQSEAFAELLRSELGRAIPLWRNTPMQANFAVLTDAEVPAILLEMGFLTNREDSRILNDARERRRLMQAAMAAIEGHFAHCGGGEPRRTYVASAGGASGR